MSVHSWIAKNPKLNVRNQSIHIPMVDAEFEQFMRSVVHAAQLLSIFARPKDKLKAVMILEPKLISMPCSEARNILSAISIANDRLEALQYIKRALFDVNTQEGVDNILATFTFEDHKIIAAKILQQVVPKRGVQVAAGGHMGYAPLGGLYTNAAPNLPHMYGEPLTQIQHLPNHKLPEQLFDSPNYNTHIQSIYSTNLPEKVVTSTYASANNYPQPSDYLNANKLNSLYS